MRKLKNIGVRGDDDNGLIELVFAFSGETSDKSVFQSVVLKKGDNPFYTALDLSKLAHNITHDPNIVGER